MLNRVVAERRWKLGGQTPEHVVRNPIDIASLGFRVRTYARIVEERPRIDEVGRVLSLGEGRVHLGEIGPGPSPDFEPEPGQGRGGAERERMRLLPTRRIERDE